MGNCHPPVGEHTFGYYSEDDDEDIKDNFDFVPKSNYINDIKEIFTIGKVLGSGVSCSVYIGKDIQTRKKYAIKEMLIKDEFNPRSFTQEVQFLSSLSPHLNILKYHTSYITPKYFYIITELCTGGALFDKIRKRKTFSEKQAAHYIRTLIKAVAHCHRNQIVHRDLKPENIVFDICVDTDDDEDYSLSFEDSEIVAYDTGHDTIDEQKEEDTEEMFLLSELNAKEKQLQSDGNTFILQLPSTSVHTNISTVTTTPTVVNVKRKSNLVIIDFGDAALIDDHEMYSEFVGTIFYLPPEIHRHRHGWEMKKSDMWTIGVIAYILVCGHPPFSGKNNKIILSRIMSGKFSFPKSIELSFYCKSFVRGLLQLDCNKRLSPKQALHHIWLRGGASADHLNPSFLTNLSDFCHGTQLKKILIDNLIERMSVEDKQILMRAFREIDDDKNGFIEEKEIVLYLMKVGQSRINANLQARKMMTAMDQNSTGKISLQQFVRAKTVAKLNCEKDLLRHSFLSLSKGEEKVTAQSLRDWIKKQNLELSDGKIDEIVHSVDINNDGFVDYEEFAEAMDNADIMPG